MRRKSQYTICNESHLQGLDNHGPNNRHTTAYFSIVYKYQQDQCCVLEVGAVRSPLDIAGCRVSPAPAGVGAPPIAGPA